MHELVTSSTFWRRIAVIGGLGLVVGAALAVGLALTRGPGVEETSSQSTHPSSVLSAAEAVIRLDGPAVATGRSAEVSYGSYPMYEIVVGEVIYQAETDDGAPRLAVGDRLVVRDFPDFDGNLGFESSGSGDLAFLGYFDVRQWPEYETGWGLTFSAVGSEDGMTYHGTRANSGKLKEDVATARAALARTGGAPAAQELPELEFLLAWIEEVHAFHRRPYDEEATPGPITDAYDLSHVFEQQEAWRSSDPAHRALDPELTPDDVLATLESRVVLLDLPRHPRSDEVYVVLRSEDGIMEVSDAVVGAHPATVLSRPDATWEIVITSDLVGLRGPVVARFAAPPAGDQHLVVTIDQSTFDEALESTDRELGELRDVARLVTRAEYEWLLKALAMGSNG